jgi:Ser/Thr protein kinase RdoA (MazF antagonist)
VTAARIEEVDVLDAWLERLVGRVTARRTFAGATSSLVEELDTARGRFVLRTYPPWTLDHLIADQLILREAKALDRLGAAAPWLQAPRVVGADPAGVDAGRPALVTTRLPGEPRLAGDAGWIEGLATTLLATARAAEAVGPLGPFAPWYDEPLEVPAWTSEPAAWSAAVAAVVELPPSHGRGVHRDFHPANVLWEGSAVTGVIDWVNACDAPIETDVARCRMNLAVLAGADAADAFLELTGLPFDHRWDLVIACEMLPDPRLVSPLRAMGAAVDLDQVRRSFDAFVVAALARSTPT